MILPHRSIRLFPLLLTTCSLVLFPCVAGIALTGAEYAAPASSPSAFETPIKPALAADSAGKATATAAPTLAECLMSALDTNPGVLSAEDETRASKQRLKQASSNLLPRLKAEETFTNFRHTSEILGRPFGKEQLQLEGIKLSQPIYTGGALENGVKAARAGVNLQKHAETRRREDMVRSVAEAWFGLLSARAMEEVASQALLDTLGHQRHVQSMLEAGVAVRDDLLKVQVSVLERRENLVKARNGIDLAKARLEMLTGLSIDPSGIPIPENPDITPELSEPHAVSLATRSHPLLRAAREAVRIQDFSAKAAKGSLQPNVALQWNWSSGNQFNTAQDNWDATVYVGLNVFDGGETRSKVREARAARSKATHDLEDLERTILLAIHQAFLRIEEARARLELSTQAEAQAAESLRLTEERFKAGAVTSQNLLDAESALVSARQRRVTAGFDRALASIALWHAAGSLEHALLPLK
ncbi:MAG TPA: TolC family protein [Candidatus Ozemobacteraceae bacterium]